MYDKEIVNTYKRISKKKIHLNVSSSIALYVKTNSIPESKFREILAENTTIIAHEVNK